MPDASHKKTNWRWSICALLFAATAVNYFDSQVLALTYEDFIKPRFFWSDVDYATITSFFTFFYAIACLFAGRFVDWIGAKRGCLVAMGVWAMGACFHGLTSFFIDTIIPDAQGVELLEDVSLANSIMVAVSTLSVYMFMVFRGVSALGMAGYYPSAIKSISEFFPSGERALATTLMSAGSLVGALAAPLFIPALAVRFGWESAFIVSGGLGVAWMMVWAFVYDKPQVSPHVNMAELRYITAEDGREGEAGISLARALRSRHAWAFASGRFFTEGVWWFFLLWVPSYFSSQFEMSIASGEGRTLMVLLYATMVVVAVAGAFFTKLLITKSGLNSFTSHTVAMFVVALLPLAALFATNVSNPWAAAVLIGSVGAAHHCWNANLASSVSDMFPKGAVATVTGFGVMAGGLGALLIQETSGWLLTYSEAAGEAFRFLGVTGRTAGYSVLFCYCSLAYMIASCVMKLLTGKHARAEV